MTVEEFVRDLDTKLPDAARTTTKACFCRPWSEDKLAGVLLLAEHGLSSLTIGHLPELAAPLADGHLADWNTVDWYCVKTLSPFLVLSDDVEDRCRRVAQCDLCGQRR